MISSGKILGCYGSRNVLGKISSRSGKYQGILSLGFLKKSQSLTSMKCDKSAPKHQILQETFRVIFANLSDVSPS